MNNDQSVQLQIAQNVKLEVARTAIVGYQGQEPVVEAPRRVTNMAKNLRWKLLIIVGVIALVGVFAFYPPDQKVRLGLDLKGGVHLVMRVQTDDAVRLETETTADRLREQLQDREHPGRDGHASSSPTEFRVDRRARPIRIRRSARC